jgi:predicted nucleotidyltransferase
MDSLREQVTKICRVLNENEVDYIIVGGLAVIFHGYPRSTSDIDFWYKPTVSNFQRLINSLDSLGVDTSDLKKLVFDPLKTYLRVPSLSIRSEFLPQIEGLTYPESKKNVAKAELDGVIINIMSLEDLIENKKKVNRPKDKLDVDELEKRNKLK